MASHGLRYFCLAAGGIERFAALVMYAFTYFTAGVSFVASYLTITECIKRPVKLITSVTGHSVRVFQK